VLGRALDALYGYGVTELFSLISANAAIRLNLKAGFGHPDSTGFHTDGKYDSDGKETEGVIRIVKGYSRDHRPELNQVVSEMIAENQAGIPMLMKPLSGNSSDKTDFGVTIEAHIRQIQNYPGVEYIVADRSSVH